MCYIGKETGGVMKYMIGTLITVAALASPAWAGNDVRVLEVRGEAAMRTGVDGKWVPLLKGALLKAGCWIQTSLGTRLYLMIWNNTVVQILSASLVEIEKVEEKGNRQTGRLNLALGMVKVNVRRDRTEIVDFRVNSPRMTTAVKGTSWSQAFFAHLALSVMGVDRGRVAVERPGSQKRMMTRGTGLCGTRPTEPGEAGASEQEGMPTEDRREGGRMDMDRVYNFTTTMETAKQDHRKLMDGMPGTSGGSNFDMENYARQNQPK
jgi:hypothetical protein